MAKSTAAFGRASMFDVLAVDNHDEEVEEEAEAEVEEVPEPYVLPQSC